MKEVLGTKVVHVHFIHGRKNYYFGSISAIFSKFSENQIGVSEDYLRHYLCKDEIIYLNKEVMIIRSRIIRKSNR